MEASMPKQQATPKKGKKKNEKEKPDPSFKLGAASCKPSLRHHHAADARTSHTGTNRNDSTHPSTNHHRKPVRR
jgi:hypothetical protein